MKLIDIFRIIENKIAPVALSDELCKKYGHYDNSGILVENEGEITGVLFSLDFTPEAAEEAVRRGCNLLVTGGKARVQSLGYSPPCNLSRTKEHKAFRRCHIASSCHLY